MNLRLRPVSARNDRESFEPAARSSGRSSRRVRRFARRAVAAHARVLVAWSVLGVAAACAPAATLRTVPPADPSGFRIVVPATGEQLTMASMNEMLTRSDIIFFGEVHDDRETHRAEVMVLDALGRSKRPVVLSLEMFERDVQPVLDDYLAGRITEAELLAASRPWPNYPTDYRPLVEMAKANNWPVVASNVPRRIASAIARHGLAVLDSLPARERTHAARDILCPDDGYRTRFMAEMRSHSPAGARPSTADTLPTAVAERYYLAQCAKDETMAESIVEARRRAPRNAIVVHFNGAFHSDFGHGTHARVRRREPRWATVGISAVPSHDPATEAITPHVNRADFIIFTRRP